MHCVYIVFAIGDKQKHCIFCVLALEDKKALVVQSVCAQGQQRHCVYNVFALGTTARTK